jgi:pantothenate kinase
MESVYDALAQRARDLQSRIPSSTRPRAIIALAGPPGCGKSTIAAQVVRRLGPSALAVPIDGFHYTRAELDSWPNSVEAHERRGASWTFDAAGVVGLAKQLRQARELRAPTFDHARKDPEPDAIYVSPDVNLVILEGNYLLFDEEPWRQVPGLVDETWFVDVAPELARDRVARRHIASGIESTWEAAIARAEGNDLRNGNEVRAKLISPDATVQSIEVKV